MALTKQEQAAVACALCSIPAAKEFLKAITEQRAPSLDVQKRLAILLGDQLNAKRVNAVQELILKMATGKSLSKSTQRRLAIGLGNAALAKKIYNMIESVDSPLIKL